MSGYKLVLKDGKPDSGFEYQAYVYDPEGREIGFTVGSTKWGLRRWAKKVAKRHIVQQAKPFRSEETL